jgi:hypothetical protein
MFSNSSDNCLVSIAKKTAKRTVIAKLIYHRNIKKNTKYITEQVYNNHGNITSRSQYFSKHL